MNADAAPKSALSRIVTLGAAAVGLTLAAMAVVFLLHGRHWFVKQGYPEAAAVALGVSEIAGGLLLAVPRTRRAGVVVLFGVLGWAAGFHFALRQATGGLFGWMAAVAAVALASGYAAPSRPV